MEMQLNSLLTERARLLQRADGIVQVAKRLKRDLFGGEADTVDSLLNEVGSIDVKIRAIVPQDQIPLPASLARATTAKPHAAADTSVIAKARAVLRNADAQRDPRRGFESFGEFAVAVRKAFTPDTGAIDERLLVSAAAPGTYGNEGTGVDGGFAVPPEFARQIVKLSLDSDAFLPMTDQIPVVGNSMTFPSDETTPWGTNGVRAYWTQEAALGTATKPVIKPNSMRLKKLVALVPMSDELLADAGAAEAFLASRFARAITWKVNDAFVNGDGAGMPFGIANCPALVVIAKDAGQAANTVSGTNLVNMLAAMPADYLKEAVWLMDPDAWTKSMSATLQNVGVWTAPPPGAAAAPGGYILGKPVFPSQTCSALSSQGDIYLVNWRAYTTISKPIQIASSMHIYFDADSTAFRCTFRVDGQPAFKSAITQAHGTQTQSPYVTLAAR